jgi:ferritin
MGISDSMTKGLNEQLARELTAHFLYRAIAMDLYEKGYEGFAAWMDTHAGEEYGHAERIISYLRENDVRVILPAIEKPKETWKSVNDAVEAALGHEVYLTKEIHQLHKQADDEGDLATVSMLDWFVTEQVEEEHIVKRLLKRISLAGNSEIGLVVIDGELGGSAGKSAAGSAE